MSNELEYLTGTDPLDSGSKQVPRLSFEDLGSGREVVFSFQLSNLPDDNSLVPTISSDLQNWSSLPLELIDTIQAENGTTTRLRFRVNQASAKSQFLRLDKNNVR